MQGKPRLSWLACPLNITVSGTAVRATLGACAAVQWCQLGACHTRTRAVSLRPPVSRAPLTSGRLNKSPVGGRFKQGKFVQLQSLSRKRLGDTVPSVCKHRHNTGHRVKRAMSCEAVSSDTEHPKTGEAVGAYLQLGLP
ncbi:hypothetical protein NDU88_007573 [Pleurodeles waltl]|uniref:Secreted protein n=1 Tax=Pleurodeles waltl TaxID=8319 RepID=A0AAV7QLC0_PLEWA|nr:hypothetical protein NDU88_007573 [Pleurodeles waltl]